MAKSAIIYKKVLVRDESIARDFHGMGSLRLDEMQNGVKCETRNNKEFFANLSRSAIAQESVNFHLVKQYLRGERCVSPIAYGL